MEVGDRQGLRLSRTVLHHNDGSAPINRRSPVDFTPFGAPSPASELWERLRGVIRLGGGTYSG